MTKRSDRNSKYHHNDSQRNYNWKYVRVSTNQTKNASAQFAATISSADGEPVSKNSYLYKDNLVKQFSS